MDFGEFKIPEECVVYKSEHTFVFVNIRPFLPYHLLVSPIQKYSRLLDMPDDVAYDIMSTIRKTMRCLNKYGEAYSLIIQDGESAGQSVNHAHFHIMPRKKGDLTRNDDVYDELNLDCSRPNRSLETMKEEAASLRKLFIEENSK